MAWVLMKTIDPKQCIITLVRSLNAFDLQALSALIG
jgi:hypothetical protein